MMFKEMLSYYNLSQLPFSKEIKTSQLHQLPTVEKALLSAKLLVETKGIGIMTGKSGSGKSCILRLLKEHLNPVLYKVVYICHSSIGVYEFYTHLAAALGLPPRGRRSTMFRDIKERILFLNNSQKTHPVLLLDEAHMLNYDILQEIRLLTNFEIDSVNALTVCLCGQESLVQKFGLSILESLANSITITIQIGNLPREETYSFIEKRIHDCGNSSSLYTKGALALIHQASAGIFRSIGLIAQAALHKAFLSKAGQVEAEHVKAVIAR
jgi:type II secretory pathway predicted ATPase ExeA